MTRHFLIDTDTASDDAVALVMAMRYPDVQIEAITVVAGNVPVDQGVQNALYTVELVRTSHPGTPRPASTAHPPPGNSTLCARRRWHGRYRAAAVRPLTCLRPGS